MRIEHDEDEKLFEAYSEDGEKMGELEYLVGGGNELYATHTEVLSRYEGRGLAGKLVDALFDFAVSINAKVIPICPYVVYAFRENPKKYSMVIKTRPTQI